ncbi:MAG TPA: lamin tail domain-containing protein, partial [Bacteroidales bacterium]|nr:lamin tail domain-containing protein [Bacteroidales bacterium]
MRKISVLVSAMLILLLGIQDNLRSQASMTPVFVNEIHYDNDGPDLNEIIEIAGPAGTDLSDYLLYLYNGSGGLTYAPGNPFYLNGIIPDQGNGFGTVCFSVPGIQNGTPDGIAIVYFPTGALYPVVKQFVSYEGFFPANNGPAVGDTSLDIGVYENTTSPVGFSLQLGGFGSTYEDFLLTGGWQWPTLATCGSPNNNQTFMVLDYCTDFLDFWMLEQTGPALIDTVNNTVQVEVRTGTDLTQLVAYFDLCWFAEVTDTASGGDVESGDSARDFSQPVVWRIDNLKPSQYWTITVTEQVPEMVINEVDYDQPSSDISEFIELKNNGPESVNIAGMQLRLIDGSGSVYATYTIPSHSLAPGNYFVICGNAANTMNCDWDITPDAHFISNGAPAAIALYTHTGSLVDAVSYEGSTPGYNENGGTLLADPDAESKVGLSRYPDGTDTDDNAADLSLLCITPGYANAYDTIPCICTITGVSLDNILPCDSMTSTFDAYLTVTYAKAPGSGYLVVNGVNHALTGSPQTILLENIPALNGPVAVSVHFSENPSCSWYSANLFTSPDPCGKCYVVDAWAGSQGSCVPATNFYTQEIHLDVMFNPGGQWVVTVGGVSDTTVFVPLSGNTGMLSVSGLISDGAPVSGTIRNLLIPGCVYMLNGEWTAPANCYDSPEIVVNEVDYDQPGADGAEFIELKNNESFPVNLDGYFVELINGGTGLAYDRIWLPDVNLAPGDYFVMCADPLATDYCDMDLGAHLNLASLPFGMDDGAPDAVALHDIFGTMVDVVSYEGDVAGHVEGTGAGVEDDGTAEGHSISRYPDGVDTDDNATDFRYRCITPGEPNTYLYGYCGPFHSLDLLVRYKNSEGTPMPGVDLGVSEAKGAVGSYTTGAGGWVTIDSLKNMNYAFSVDASLYPWGWGGVNALDALLIARHFTNLSYLVGDFLAVADVTAINGVNTTDAQRVAMRFAMGDVISFGSGDWYPIARSFGFSAPVNTQFTDTLELLCFGDVNGTHIPTAPVKASEVLLSIRGSVSPDEGRVSLPLRAGEEMKLGALSVRMAMPL